jgi:hypothetical protein
MVTWYCFDILFHPFHYKGIFVRVYISVSYSCVSACENPFSALCISSYIYKKLLCLEYLTFVVMVTWYSFALLFHLFHYKGIFLRVYIRVSFSCVSASENAFNDTMHFLTYIKETIMFLVLNIWGYGHLRMFRSFIWSISI